ncbi:MAG: hypothetical protein ACI8X3_001292 [Saprospiraceae bacterium]
MGADFMISDNLSIEGSIGFTSGKESFGSDDDYKYTGIPITVFGKYYFNPDNGADKFYVDAWLRFVSRTNKYKGSSSTFYGDYSQTRVGIGFGIGYKVVSVGGFVFDIGLGAGRAFIDNTSYDNNGQQESFDWPDIMFAGKVGVGYRFGGK